MQKLLSGINRQSTAVTSLISILLGMLVGAVAMLASGYNPVAAYNALFISALVEPFDMGETIRTISPLILTGLAVAIAFRTGLFNIGVEGQFIVGQLVAVIIALYLPLPPGLNMIVAMILGGVAGALWGAVPGILKATRGVHEVIISIMMNWIALYLSNVLIRTSLSEGADSTEKIPEAAMLRADFLTEMFDRARIHLGIFVALIAAALMYWLLWRTRLGYELRAVGHNPLAAEYAGMNVKRNIVMSMMISGLFAGLAGSTEALGTSGYLSIQHAFNGIGFDGIAVALLGANTPVGVILSAVLFGVLTYGGGNMQFAAGVPFEVIRIVFAAIILFVAANVSGKILEALRRKKGGDQA
ncbi:ABC transporter permease [Staphylospora marina]|uniref:ABC transporter permease n=1 Tax=Staphylospora marina TaxID=2490858 RepID=UPI000F5BCD9F|nr:ABC transporter permease [Staphylospora marina]